MIAAGYGRIVNIASIAGKEGNPNASHYSASKAGLIGLTKSLGKELATKGVLVNCITPAAAKTELFAQMKQEHIDYMLSKIPMNRFVEVDELAVDGCMAFFERLLVLDRRGVRYFRRPGGLLSVVTGVCRLDPAGWRRYMLDSDSGRLAQRKSTSLTWKGSQVRSLYRPPVS